MVRAIGADHVLDYTQEDFTQNGDYYDLIFDVVAKRSFSVCKRALKPRGIYITTEFSPVMALRGSWKSMTGNQKMVPFLSKPPNNTDLIIMKDLLESGKVAPVIDRTYPLREVPESIRYLSKEHARGKAIISI